MPGNGAQKRDALRNNFVYPPQKPKLWVSILKLLIWVLPKELAGLGFWFYVPVSVKRRKKNCRREIRNSFAKVNSVVPIT